MRTPPTLPDPCRREDGSVACNEPLIVNCATVGYCAIYVKPRWSGFLRRTPPMTHPGRQHSIHWGPR